MIRQITIWHNIHTPYCNMMDQYVPVEGVQVFVLPWQQTVLMANLNWVFYAGSDLPAL